MDEQTHWVHNLDPFLLRFPDGFFLDGLRWYGLAYVAGFVMAILMLRLYYKSGRTSLNPDAQMNLITALILGTLVGGRLGYMVFYDWHNFVQNPLTFFQVWKGGMASHGGILGILLATFIFARLNKVSFFHLVDLVATVSPFGIVFGRIANFINGELWGKTSDVAWAVIFPIKNSAGAIIDYTLPRHPSQLYEALLEGLILLIYLQARFWLSSTPKRYPGQVGWEFFIAYPILRILGEMFREPDASLIMGLSRGTFYSIFMIAIGIAGVLYARRQANSAQKVA